MLFRSDDFSESDTYTINLLATFSGIKKWGVLNKEEKFNFEIELTEENIKKDINNIPFKEIKLYFNNNFSLLDFNAFKKAMYLMLMEKSILNDSYYISNSKSRFVYNPFYVLTDLFYCEDFYCDSYSYYSADHYKGCNISRDIIENENMKKKFFSRTSDYYKAISKNDFFENLFFVIANIESFMLPNKIINNNSYNEIMKKIEEIKKLSIGFYKANIGIFKSWLNSFIRNKSKNSFKNYNSKLGTRIDYAMYIFILNVLKNDINNGVDVCKEYGLSKNNLSSIICNFD